MAENVSAEADAPGDETASRSLEVYEWGGGIVASLGFFLTPAVTGIPALYCALKVRDEKPLAAAGIGAVVLVTAFFWAGFLFAEPVVTSAPEDFTIATIAVLFLFSLVILGPLAIFLVFLVWRR